MQSPVLEAVPNRSGREPQGEELPSRDGPMLPPSQCPGGCLYILGRHSSQKCSSARFRPRSSTAPAEVASVVAAGPHAEPAPSRCARTGRVRPVNVKVLAAGGTIAMSGAGGAKLALDAADL